MVWVGYTRHLDYCAASRFRLANQARVADHCVRTLKFMHLGLGFRVRGRAHFRVRDGGRLGLGLS